MAWANNVKGKTGKRGAVMDATIIKMTKKITCDEVVWISDVFGRFEEVIKLGFPGTSKLSLAARVAAIMELCEILDLEPNSDAAFDNISGIIIHKDKQRDE